jgi:hypothetical protein
MTRPQTPYEAASYDLKKFRDRRMADSRFSPWTSEERRIQQNISEQNVSDVKLAVKRKPEKRLADVSQKMQIGLCGFLNKAAALFK